VQGIDGEKFLKLTEDDLIDFFHLPLGIALKISSAITILRNRVPQPAIFNNIDSLELE
jgi:hypothetical protein